MTDQSAVDEQTPLLSSNQLQSGDASIATTTTSMSETRRKRKERSRHLFLSTVRMVQAVKRMEKLNKNATALRLLNFSNANAQAHGANASQRDSAQSERVPLMTSSRPTLLSFETASDGGGGGDGSLQGDPPQQEPTSTDTDEILLNHVKYTTSDTIQSLLTIVAGKGLISACLLVAPVAVIAVHAGWSDTWIFWLNFVVMIPLAAILGDFTEEVALHTNDTIGGLVNASFGNAVEVVVAIQALLADEIRVVQASMLGSILSNLLLVLGSCFFFGGIYHSEQTFNSTSATANMGLLALSGIALVLPTPFAEYYELHDEHVLMVSRCAAVFLLAMYVQLLIFQLHTHAYLFDAAEEGDVAAPVEMASISCTVAVLGLCITTGLVTIFSDYLVESIDGFTEASGVSRTFVGIILLPIVGNAVEHFTAVMVAAKNKMDLAMGIAIGSCTQISLFVVPLTVLVGWGVQKDMNLNFPHFEVVLFVLSVMTVSIVLSNPKCNWLEGSLLITTYILLAVGFWFENVRNF